MKELYQPEAASTVLFAFIGNPWALLGCYLLVMNLITFFVFGIDKWKAKRKRTHESTRRVPEKTLFLLSILGGSVGALVGMKVFHHKTRKWYFRFGIPAILILQIAAAALYFAHSAGLLNSLNGM